MTTERMLSPRDLSSEQLNIPVQTLYQWRCRGERSPPPPDMARHVKYRIEDIEARWTTSRKRQPRGGRQ